MDFDQVSPRSMEYLSKVNENPAEFKQLTLQFIAMMESKNILVPDFEETYDWLNTSAKLSFKSNLSKKLVIMDFFTYCCINCMHVLPDLHALEQKFSIEDGVAVIGVHSAKFENEKLLVNILSAVLRYDIAHPVVNDADAVLWNKMSIRCWPTFVIVSPEGKVLLYLVGEGHREVLSNFVGVAMDYYKQKELIDSHTLPIKLARDHLKSEALKFPGKLTVSPEGDQIAIADTGNHRIALISKSGVLITKVGKGITGFQDGSFSDSTFNAPQGLLWLDKCIYVADTENHAIRKINVETKQVTTLTGTGHQGNDKEGGKEGILQEISSPWDVLAAPAPGSDSSSTDTNCLYIAMAGTHQIWAYYLENGCWLKKGTQKKDTCLRFAGSGNEENRNNSYPHKASFAQPSGFTFATVKDQKFIYIADSESSSVRSLDLKTGAVKASVGGERDPTNLFGFGDIDGKGVNAKLQHPLAVAFNQSDGMVYVADSYNHKIKVVDPIALTCTTLAGTGKAGFCDGDLMNSQFNEPGGLSFDQSGKVLYVADTNNHKVRVLNLDKKIVSTIALIDADEVDALSISNPFKQISQTANDTNQRFIENFEPGVTMHLQLQLGSLKFTEDVDSTWKLSAFKQEDSIYAAKGTINKSNPVIISILPKFETDVEVKFELIMYLCTTDGTCTRKSITVPYLLFKDDGEEKKIIEIPFEVNL